MIALMVYTSEPLNLIGLDLLFRSAEDISLQAIVTDLSVLFSQVASRKPNVILLSVDASVDWTLLDQLRREHPDARIVLWMHDASPEAAYQAIECGIRGILRKNLPSELILKCVRKVYAGEMWFEKALTQSFLSGRPIKVSRREGELITLVSQGLKNKEIATVMDISEGTVKVYLSRLFSKFGARDRFELALVGLRNSKSWIEQSSNAVHGLTYTIPSARESLAPAPKKPQANPARVLFARTAQ